MTSSTPASFPMGTADGLPETEKNAGESENTYILRPIFQQRRVTDGLCVCGGGVLRAAGSGRQRSPGSPGIGKVRGDPRGGRGGTEEGGAGLGWGRRVGMVKEVGWGREGRSGAGEGGAGWGTEEGTWWSGAGREGGWGWSGDVGASQGGGGPGLEKKGQARRVGRYLS